VRGVVAMVSQPKRAPYELLFTGVTAEVDAQVAALKDRLREARERMTHVATSAVTAVTATAQAASASVARVAARLRPQQRTPEEQQQRDEKAHLKRRMREARLDEAWRELCAAQARDRQRAEEEEFERAQRQAAEDEVLRGIVRGGGAYFPGRD
jgi:hypothetical protein